MPESILHRFKQVGTLRQLLTGLAILYILILPFSSPARILEGWDLILGGIVPATAPLVFIVMMFDVMMCQIMKSDASKERISELNFITASHVTVGFVLLGLWFNSFREALF